MRFTHHPLFPQSHCHSPNSNPPDENVSQFFDQIREKGAKSGWDARGHVPNTCSSQSVIFSSRYHTLTLSHYIDLFFLVFFSLSRLPNKHTHSGSACARVSRSLPQRAVRPPTLLARILTFCRSYVRAAFLIPSAHTHTPALYTCVICYCCASVVMATPKTNRPT